LCSTDRHFACTWISLLRIPTSYRCVHYSSKCDSFLPHFLRPVTPRPGSVIHFNVVNPHGLGFPNNLLTFTLPIQILNEFLISSVYVSRLLSSVSLAEQRLTHPSSSNFCFVRPNNFFNTSFSETLNKSFNLVSRNQGPFSLWLDVPQWVSSLSSLHDHTQTHHKWYDY